MAKKPYFLIKKTRTLKSGKKSVLYYYSLSESSGLPLWTVKEHQRKSTGKKTKAEASAWVLSLIEELKSFEAVGGPISLEKFARNMFEESSKWVQLQRAKGRIMSEAVLSYMRGHLKNYIFPALGKCYIQQIKGPDGKGFSPIASAVQSIKKPYTAHNSGHFPGSSKTRVNTRAKLQVFPEVILQVLRKIKGQRPLFSSDPSFDKNHLLN